MDNIHVILFKKNLRNIDDFHAETWMPGKYTHWVALGHFDDIYTYEINNNSDMFSSIKKDKMHVLQHNDESSYYHPLYLIPKSSSMLQNENIQWFIGIVRIHFLQSTHIVKQFDEACYFINETIKETAIKHQIYYTTEFSDMVLELQSDRLDSLLDFVLNLRKNNQLCIGKTYTYFGINSHLLESSENPKYLDDKISLFTMRFSGYNMHTTKSQIELIRKQLDLEENDQQLEYCINGIDDIMLILKDLSSTQIINIYREWLFNDSHRIYKKSESSTRVGIDINIDSLIVSNQLSNYKPAEYILCDELPNICKKILELISVRKDEPYFGWFYAISEIANSLVRMSKTPIMDEVVYLIAPGVRAFLINILHVLNKNIKLDNSTYSYLYEYVESCSYFIEQLMRIEGQLSHNPEIRPVIYDIPVFMLEYTIAFLNKVSQLLLKHDEATEKKNTAFLLVPRPCERASATEIFAATNEFPGLVHIQIPESILYTPLEVFRSLCHEISHYVGEKYRNRNARKNAYVHAVASLIANSVFDNTDEVFLMMIKSHFNDLLKKYENPTIREMHNIIISELKRIVGQKKCIEKILHHYIDFATSQNMLPDIIELRTDDELSLLLETSFERLVYDVDILFREIFADICMIYILGIDSESYINSLLHELAMYPEPNNISEVFFAIRIYVTLTAMDKAINYNGKYAVVWNTVKELMDWISEEITLEINGKYKFPIPTNSIYALLKYAERCFKTISTCLTESDTYNVRNMYMKLLDNNFQYYDILEEIDRYRNGIIQTYE